MKDESEGSSSFLVAELVRFQILKSYDFSYTKRCVTSAFGLRLGLSERVAGPEMACIGVHCCARGENGVHWRAFAVHGS
jgi:hypothetical protein